MNTKRSPIGIFDSGFGGLTIFDKIRQALPDCDYIYLGDNARTPYGTRSYDAVYRFTREAVMHLFAEGCPLVILACNTASAKALRTIQQRDLPAGHDPSRRVLGVIRPTAEVVGRLTQTGHVGLLGTTGTIASRSYPLEIAKIFPHVTIVGEACPMWVPLVENGEADSPGADYFVKKHVERLLTRDPEIDTVILGCTHYPLLIDKIRHYLPEGVQLFSQGDRVADRLKDYLVRHPEMERRISRHADCRFQTTDSPERFAEMATLFLRKDVGRAERVTLPPDTSSQRRLR